LPPGRGIDKKNVVPRLGFAYSLNDRMVLRGGAGKFFADIPFQNNNTSKAFTISAQPLVLNDRRPDFVTNPFNGPTPTYEQVVATGVRNFSESPMASQHMQTPYSYQASVGVQRQLGQTMSVDADYVYTGTRHQTAPENNNLSYNPVTGVNYPWTDASKRPFPNFGIVDQQNTEARSNYHGLQTAFTKRFTQGWQASASYLLSGYWDEIPGPFTLDATGRAIPVPFKVAPDMGGEYTLGANDQRHRVSFNGIWQLKYGFQLSTIYLFGSGLRYATFYGGDLRLQGTQPDLAAVPTGQGRLRPDGTIVPRNSFVGDPVHKVDLRVQRTFQLAGRVHVDGIFEAFNVFNHKNYGSYTTQENTGRYGRPNTSFPRVLQLGFRFAF
jgi:hypothetical protein